MSFDYISILTATSGVVIGFILNQVVAAYRSKKEDNRIRNEAIYYLLEFRYLLSRVDFEKAYPSIIDAIVDILPANLRKEASNLDLKSMLIPSIYPLWGKLMNTTSRQYSELGANFKTIIKKLSSIDPQQAYILSGKEDIITNLSQIEESINTTKSPDSTLNHNAINDVSQILNTTTINNSIKDIEELLLVLHKKINRPFATKRCKKMLSKFSIEIKHDKIEFRKILTPIINQVSNIE